MRITCTKPWARWKPHAYDLAAPTCFLLGTGIFLGKFFGRFGSHSTRHSGFDCAADGKLLMPNEHVNSNWDPGSWLSVTLAFGSFSFSTAKAIDVSWDLIIGRGGQLLLAFLAYSTIRRSFSHAMMRTSWHMPVTTRLIFDPVSFTGLWASLKDLANRRWSWRLYAYIVMVIYISSFSTIVSAMTGYRATSSVYYRSDNNQSQILVSTLAQRKVDFVVSRCDKRGVCEGRPYFDYDEGTSPRSGPSDILFLDDCTDVGPNSEEGFGLCRRSANESASQLGGMIIYYRHDVSQSILLLDNEGFTLTVLYDDYYSYRSYELSQAAHSPYYRSPEGATLDPDQLRANTVCQPQKTYQWGVSSFLLFVFCWMTLIYASIVLSLHFELYWHRHDNPTDQHMSVYRDILNMALEIKDELGDDAENMSARELDTKITTTTGNISVENTSSRSLTDEEHWKHAEQRRRQVEEHVRQAEEHRWNRFLRWDTALGRYLFPSTRTTTTEQLALSSWRASEAALL